MLYGSTWRYDKTMVKKCSGTNSGSWINEHHSDIVQKWYRKMAFVG